LDMRLAVLDVGWGRFGLVFSSIEAVLVGAVLVCVGRFRPSLGPFWRWAVLVGYLQTCALKHRIFCQT